MVTWKKYVTIKDASQLVLTDLPFDAGQRVEILVIGEERADTRAKPDLRALFKATQALPEARSISEDEIAAEIEKYRNGL